MRSNVVIRPIGCLGMLVACLFLVSCGKAAPPVTAEKPVAKEAAGHGAEGHAAEGHGGHEGEEEGEGHGEGEANEHAGHGHGEGEEASDLDRPLDELFSATCEHAKKTFECDECRYEVGVVKVAPSILEGGLLKTVEAGPRTVDAPVVLTGEVRFDERQVTHLAPRTDGVLGAIHVQLGDRVKAGQALFEVDSIALGDAQGEYLEARAARDLASRTLERQKALRREGVSAEREMLEAETAYESADIRVRSASERLLRLGLELSDLGAIGKAGRLGSARGRLVVRAPIEGRVADMHAVAGEAAKAGESVVVIGETDPVWVFADLYEDHLGAVAARVTAGPVSAAVSVKAYPGEAFPGSLDLLGTVMDEKSRTVKARVTVSNPDGKLRPGMFAQVRLGLPGEQQALSIPRSAVMQDEGRSFVFVPHDGDYWVRRPVRTGREWQGWVEVKEGIQAGQRVAANGAFLLKSDVLRSKMGAGCAD